MNDPQPPDLSEEKYWIENIYKGNKLPELTIKAVLLGCLLCILLISTNIYMGLKTSFTEGGSIISAILAFAIIKMFRGKLSVLENNIAQTIASAAASIGIMVSVIPALILLEYSFTGFQLFLWIFFASILGILFAVPLRKQLIVIEKLPFPSGTACAETITAMHADGVEAVKKAKVLAVTGLAAGAITWFRDAVPQIIPYLTAFPGRIFNYSLSELNFGITWSPMLLGVGLLVGIRIGASLLLGAIISWLITGPVLASNNIIPAIDYDHVSEWTMWMAISLMMAAGLTSFLLKWKFIALAFSSMKKTEMNRDIEFPFTTWLIAIISATIFISVVMLMVFDIPIILSVIAVVISYLFAIVALRVTGETDVNPVGAMGHASQILYGVLAPGKILINLMTAGITASGADQSADLMQDFKTGYILGATPKKQTYAQLIGAVVGSLIAVPIFLAVINTYGLGTENLPAPSAMLWKGLAEVLSTGFSSLPPYVFIGIISGTAAGIILALFENTRFRKYIPSPLGMGIAIIIPAFYSITIFLGSLSGVILRKYFPQWSSIYYTSLASGAIAGEGLLGVVIALSSVAGLI